MNKHTNNNYNKNLNDNLLVVFELKQANIRKKKITFLQIIYTHTLSKKTNLTNNRNQIIRNAIRKQ